MENGDAGKLPFRTVVSGHHLKNSLRCIVRIGYQRMKKIRNTLLGLSVVLMAACSTPGQKAPIVDRTPGGKSASAGRVVVDRSGHYTVRKGDTVNEIARKYGQDPANIAAWNNLADRNDIKPGQVLRVQPRDTSGSVQTASIASGSGIEIRPLTTPKESAVLADTSTSSKEEEGVSWMWPTDGKIVATFQEGKSKGIDIAGSLGQKVLAAAEGRVIFASAIRGYGNLVILKHSDSLVSAYAHNKAILVKEGATVSRGQQIAEMGNTDTDRIKLHLEIRRQGKPVDPARYLPVR